MSFSAVLAQSFDTVRIEIGTNEYTYIDELCK